MTARSSKKPEEREFVVDSSIDAHADQKGSKFSKTGNRSKVQEPHNGDYSRWISANKWASGQKPRLAPVRVPHRYSRTHQEHLQVQQVTSILQRADAATETTSVLSTKPLLTAHCQRHRALLHCGDQDQFPTTGQTSVDSLSHQVQIVIGKCACMVPSPSHAKSLVYVQTIKVAITRHGSTWISSTGATLVHSMVNMIDEFSSKNVLCHLIKARRRGGSVIK